jgi:hypothetical protein
MFSHSVSKLLAVGVLWCPCIVVTATVPDRVIINSLRSEQGIGLDCSSHVKRTNSASTLVSASTDLQLQPSKVKAARGGMYSLVTVVGTLNRLRVMAIEVPAINDSAFVGTSETYDSTTAARVRYSTYVLHASNSYEATLRLLRPQLPSHLHLTADIEGTERIRTASLARLTSSKSLAERSPGDVVDVLFTHFGNRAIVQITCVLSKDE